MAAPTGERGRTLCASTDFERRTMGRGTRPLRSPDAERAGDLKSFFVSVQ